MTRPSFNIRSIEQRRDRIVADAMQPVINTTVNVDDLTDAVLRCLPAGISYDTVFESLRCLAGQRLSAIEAIRTAWRIAGNIQRLKEGIPATAWVTQHSDEWVPMQVLRVVKKRNNFGKLGYEATLRVLAGTPCPNKTLVFWSPGVLQIIAKFVGFSRPWGKYPFKGANALVGLRFLAKIEALRSQSRIFFHEVDCPASLKNWNREHVLKLRLRVDQSCPNNYRHACWQCAIGYDRCPAGTHALTYELADCENCGKQQTTFDPEDPSPFCVSCSAIARQRK